MKDDKEPKEIKEKDKDPKPAVQSQPPAPGTKPPKDDD